MCFEMYFKLEKLHTLVISAVKKETDQKFKFSPC